MKKVMAIVILLGLSCAAQANENCDRQTWISGKAAQELYASLNLSETVASNEGAGLGTGTEKRGNLIGCKKDLSGNAVCWIVEPFTGNNCD